MSNYNEQSLSVADNITSPSAKVRRKKVPMIFLFVVLIIAIGIFAYLQQPQFASPTLKQSSYQSNYSDGAFHNEVEVPVMANQQNFFVSLYKFLTEKTENAVPDFELPSNKTDLHSLDINENVMVWMGHSSYYMQLNGARYLIDPVFSDNASPVPYTNVAFNGSNIYSAQDIPTIDYLLITHDHWDHLDYPTINSLKNKINTIITPIGVGSYFQKWGFKAEQILEGDWFDSFQTEHAEVHVLPAQHFSGRMLKRNQTLWGSFAIMTPTYKVYFGGDSGYGPHFKAIGEKLGPFNVSILETGQYNKNWASIHMMPEDVAQAATDLSSEAVIPSHNSKFKLSKHSWYEPLDRVEAASQGKDYRLMTPMLGATVKLDDPNQVFEHWWKKFK